MEKTENIIAIIPARYASTRFPGKPLAMINGKPMIQWVYEGCRNTFTKLVVATDDERIMEAVERFGGEAMMTSADHRSGTERCAEVVTRLEAEQSYKNDIVVNIQGDEPLVNIQQIKQLVQLLTGSKAGIATLAVTASEKEGISDPNRVKVVTNTDHEALYFSRSPIPYRKATSPSNGTFLLHLGLYAYRTDILKAIVKLPPSPLETAESLEQLRWLENGYKIVVGMTEQKNIGVDTPEDLKRLKHLF